MKKIIKYRKLIVKQFISITIILTIAPCCDRTSPIDSSGLQPDMLVKNFISSCYQEGELSWKLYSRESAYYYDEGRSIARDITLHYYEKDKISTTVEADTAEISIDSSDIDLIGNVKMISKSGNRLITEEITWNNAKKLLETDEDVKIIKENGDIIKGTGLKANYDLEYYEIKSNVMAITENVKKETRNK